MENIWESQVSNQENLEGFAQQDLYCLLSDIVCGKCTADKQDDEACSGCPAMAVTSHLENQIMDEGISFMKLLVQEWAASSEDIARQIVHAPSEGSHYTGILSGIFYLDGKQVSEKEFRWNVNELALKKAEELKGK